MGTVRNILQTKGQQVFSVEPAVTVYNAIEIMSQKNIGGLLVTDKGSDKLLGIFTERDYARRLILKGKSSKDTEVREIMTENPVTVTPDDSIDECMKLMTNRRIRHLPVCDNGRLTEYDLDRRCCTLHYRRAALHYRRPGAVYYRASSVSIAGVGIYGR